MAKNRTGDVFIGSLGVWASEVTPPKPRRRPSNVSKKAWNKAKTEGRHLVEILRNAQLPTLK